jgi:ribosomal protein L16 Arg81 hydroxylase
MAHKITRVSIGSPQDPDFLSERSGFHNEMDFPAPALKILPTDFIKRVLAPLDPEKFVDSYFEKRHWFRDSCPEFNIQEHFTLQRLIEMISYRNIQSSEIVAFDKGAGTGRTIRENENNILDLSRHVFSEGDALLFTALQVFDKSLNDCVIEFQEAFGVGVNLNAYLSPPRIQAVPCHWDHHDVLVFQVSGEKEWFIYEPRYKLPTFQIYTQEKTKLIDRVVMKPGSMLYLPKGFLHEAKGLNSPSLHVSFGLYPVTSSDIFRHLLKQAVERCEKDLSFRYSVFPNTFQDQESGDELLKFMKKKLFDYFDDESAPSVFQSELLKKIRPKKWREERIWESLSLLNDIDLSNRLERTRQFFKVDRSRYPKTIQVILKSEKLLVPKAYLPLLDRVLSQNQPFRLQELDLGEISEKDALDLVMELAKVGLILIGPKPKN